MKKIINGKTYNTDTAKKIAVKEYGDSTKDLFYSERSLYQKKDGEYFIHSCGGAGTIYATEKENGWTGSGEVIEPVTAKEAEEFMSVYIIMDYKDGDLFTTEFEKLDEAIFEAECQWNYLTEKERDARDEFFILKSINPDVDAENHLDGDIVRRWK